MTDTDEVGYANLLLLVRDLDNSSTKVYRELTA